jgi:hypothetical protein
MGCDMATALPGATVDGSTLFGCNSNRPVGEAQALAWAPARDHAPGETVRVHHITVSQPRRTYGHLGVRPPGIWGLLNGVNENGVAVGVTPVQTRLRGEQPGLTGADLVRLVLERAANALQAVDAAADLIARFGQGPFAGCNAEDDRDNALLIADGREAFLLTACGRHWAVQHVGRVRALGEVCCVRRDWDRISPGLSSLAIARGWWPEDGSKLDFAGALAVQGPEDASALRRWGRATVLLEEQSGAIDLPFVRRLLGDHGEDDGAAVETPAGALCRHPSDEAAPAAASSFIAHVGGGTQVMAWWSFGAPCSGLYFPLVLEAEPPAAFRADGAGADGCPAWRRLARQEPSRREERRDTLADLQAHFDQTAADYLVEATALAKRGEAARLPRLAESFMQHNWERFEAAWQDGGESDARRPGRKIGVS